MTYVILWAVFWGIIGSFGTAYLHERTGRDVTMGGLLGGLVGAVGGVFLLTLLWVWLYYGGSGPVWRVHGLPRKRWYRWWE
jgi:hypothetical protein